MNTSRRIVKKRKSLFARITWKGGEVSFPLGRVQNSDAAIARYDSIVGALGNGKDPAQIKKDLREGRNPCAPLVEQRPSAPPELTVSAAVKRWIAEHVTPDLEPENAATIQSRVERHLLPFFEGQSIRSIRRSDCHAYKGHLRTRRPDLKAGTLVHYLRDLRELLNWCEEVELIYESPWPRRRTRSGRGGIMPRIDRTPPDRLTDEEVEALVQLSEPWGFNLRLAISTACRWGELCRLRRTDLLPDGSLLVRQAKDGEPRTVPVPPKLLIEIMQRKGPLFVTRSGKPYSEKSNGAFNATIAEMSGVKRFHVHMTRHTFACRYLEARGELPMLQEILGHASVTTTQRYGRPNAKAIRADSARVYAAWEASNREQNREQAPGDAKTESRTKCTTR